MAEENTVEVDTTADFFCEEYGWVAAKVENMVVRADVAERWIKDGWALPAAEKKSP